MELMQGLAKRTWTYHSHGTGHLSYAFMRNCTTFSFDHRKLKTNRFLNNSSKARDAHLHMQNQMRAVCTECITSSHMMSFKTSQMDNVDRTQIDCNTLWGYSPSPYISWRLHCLGSTQRRTLCLFPYEVKDYQLLMVSFQSWEKQVSYPGYISESRHLEISIQRKEGDTQLTPPKWCGYKNSWTLDRGGGTGSQMFLKKWD